jgi:4-amino-4-deoxy-L-arabinose transferase-like glycosyltransferase
MPPATEPGTGGKTKWWLLGIGILVLVLLRNQPWDCLTGYDQAKQAFVSLEMVQDGRWWYQHLPTGYPATKPPLAGWLSAALYPLSGGWWEGAWRAPSLLAFMGILWILGKTAWSVGREWGAFLALAFFSINMLTIRLATLVRTDMLLALTILLGGLMIWRQIRKDQPWSPSRRMAFALIVLAGCFTKGPVIVVYLLLPLLTWQLIGWRRREPSHAWPGWWPWLVPIGVFALWLTVGCLNDHQFFRMVVLKEFGTNFAAISVADSGDITIGSRNFEMMLIYPLQLLHRLFPWSLAILIWLLVDRQGRRRLMSDAGARWLVVWTGMALLMMSIIPNKRVDRIFPIVAPLALLGAYGVAAGTWREGQRWSPRRVIGGLTLVSFLVWGGYTLYWQLDRHNPEKNAELARRDLCRQVSAYARTAQRDIRIAGPVSDLNQSLMTTLRCTKPVAKDTLGAELKKRSCILMPLPADGRTNDAWHVVFWTDRVTEKDCGYALLIGTE